MKEKARIDDGCRLVIPSKFRRTRDGLMVEGGSEVILRDMSKRNVLKGSGEVKLFIEEELKTLGIGFCYIYGIREIKRFIFSVLRLREI